MNIHFFTSDPVLNANYLDDIRVRKMITENFQMLAAALHRHGFTEYLPTNKQGKPYGNSHPKHPSTLWTGDSRSNFLWLCTYTEALYARYKRSGGEAFTNVLLNLKKVREGALNLPEKGLTEFANCARSKNLGIDHTNNPDVCNAYIEYMNDRWDLDTIKLTWTGI